MNIAKQQNLLYPRVPPYHLYQWTEYSKKQKRPRMTSGMTTKAHYTCSQASRSPLFS